MAEQRRCGQCGGQLPVDAPGGLCPECLLKVGLQTQSNSEPAGGQRHGKAELPTTPYAQSAEASATSGRVSLAPGQQFGGYHIIRRLGSGGMGTVYEAHHLESGRRLALKVLGHGFDSPDARQRFLREGRLAASVNHPNSVYVFGTEEIDGTAVIAMELVPGGTLEERVLRSGPLPVGEAVDAILQVIDGLEAAEARGVLHRDVKPANCFVDRDDRVKVGDFGLSISISLRGQSNLTTDGTFLGTPAFSSPEQLRGDELDLRSDVYAVGVTLYYLLTGRMPFKADNLIRLIATVLEGSPASPADLRAEIPTGLAQAVLRCLQKQPAARFTNYDALRRALSSFSSAAPTPAPLRLRLAAGIIDQFLWGVMGILLSFAWFRDLERMSSQNLYNSPDFHQLFVVNCLLLALYFAVSEGIWGASPGKAICRLRVVGPKRNAAGVPRALARAAVYILFPQSVMLTYVGLVSTGVIGGLPGWSVMYSYYVLLPLMFSTARRPNGLAGFHDLLSSTRVILKSAYQARPALAGEEEPLPDTKATPAIGPYHVLGSLDKVLGSLDKTPREELLLGYDSRLLRKVWIRTLCEGEPAVAAKVRELSRPGRLRWLAGKRAPGECWDAYEAPSGSPLVNLLDHRQPWESVRYWLVDLAEELGAGLKERSLPAVLALDRIWITSEGRAKLLDFPAPGVDRQSPWRKLPAVAGDDPASRWPFLNQVAVAALEGRAVEPQEAGGRAVAVPLPLHAKGVLDELPTAEGPELLAIRLKPLLGRTPSVTRTRRLGLLAGCVVPLILMAALVVLGLFMNRWWLDEHPDVAPLHHCLKRLETLERASSPTNDARTEERRALDVYVAGRFGNTISDPAIWSSAFAGSLFSKNQRRIAQRALAAYPHPSEEDVIEATARLQPFLDEMPDGLPGISAGMMPSPVIIPMMACGTLLVWVAIPSVICALLFRGGLLMYVFGIAVVGGDGARASRLRTCWRSLVTWSPCLLLPIFLALLMPALGTTWSICLLLALLTAVVTWSVSMPERGIPDRIAGTYPVPR